MTGSAQGLESCRHAWTTQDVQADGSSSTEVHTCRRWAGHYIGQRHVCACGAAVPGRETGTCPVCRLDVELGTSGVVVRHPQGTLGHAKHVCWCGERAEYLQPVDICVTDATAKHADGEPAQLVCTQHVTRDGFERIAS